MNARLSNKNILVIAKEILGLAGVACLALACAAPAWAGTNQAAGNQAATPPAATAPKPATNVSPGAPVPGAPPSASAERPKGGNHEGIQVHGHWTIEVRNPDGKLVTRREFENSLSPTGNSPGGAALLSASLSRYTTLGSWEVDLENSANGSYEIIVGEPNSASSTRCTNLMSGNPPGNISCSTNLSVVGGYVSQGGTYLTTLTFNANGQVPANFPAQIGFIGTVNYTCNSNVSPQGCLGGSAVSQNFNFTSRSLDGNTVPGDPLPVPVTSGQTVAVTVVISFSSPGSSN